MVELPKPQTNNLHESEWDHHGSYQWTYFDEGIKQRISYFLEEKLHGNNLEVGGGWYLSYPDSTVVDLSAVCLDYNPAKNKLHFDLDTLGEGANLPYPDHSFNSATVISTWQYLQHPHAVIKELERILKPGAEVYIINGQGSGLESCIVGLARTHELQEYFQRLGYDTLIEHIPSYYDVREFQSLCVAMPHQNLLGENVSKIRDKARRQAYDEIICRKPKIFVESYRDWEIARVRPGLRELAHFPVTAYSQNVLESIEEESQKYYGRTGNIPIVFSEHAFEPEFAMLLPDYRYFQATTFLMVETQDNYGPGGLMALSTSDDFLRSYKCICSAKHCNYFDFRGVAELLKYCEGFELRRSNRLYGSGGNETKLATLVQFIASLGLNSFTTNLQSEIYQRLVKRVPELDELIKRERAFGLHFAVRPDKQRRKIDQLIEVKRRIESGEVPVVETRELDYQSLVEDMRSYIF